MNDSQPGQKSYRIGGNSITVIDGIDGALPTLEFPPNTEMLQTIILQSLKLQNYAFSYEGIKTGRMTFTPEVKIGKDSTQKLTVEAVHAMCKLLGATLKTPDSIETYWKRMERRVATSYISDLDQEGTRRQDGLEKHTAPLMAAVEKFCEEQSIFVEPDQWKTLEILFKANLNAATFTAKSDPAAFAQDHQTRIIGAFLLGKGLGIGKKELATLKEYIRDAYTSEKGGPSYP